MAPTYSREQLIDIYNTQLAAEQAQSAPSVSESPSLLTVPSVAPAPTTTKPKYTRDELINFYNMQTESEPQTLGENLTSATKQLFAGGLEGSASIAGMLSDALRLNPLSSEGTKNIANAIQTGDWFPTSAAVGRVSKEWLPAKNDNDNLDRYARTVGEFVGPSALSKLARPIMGLFGLGSQAAAAPSLLKVGISDATMGLGAQAAEDLTGNETIAPIVGAVGASVLPKAVASGLGAVKQAFVKAGDDSIKATAAQILKEQTGLTADKIDEALANVSDNELKQFVTTAEATRNPTLSQYQKTLGGVATADGGGADAMLAHQLKRESTRNEILNRLTDSQSVNNDRLGESMVSTARELKEDRAIINSKLWTKLDRGEVLDVTPLQDYFKKEVELKRGYGTLGLDNRVAKIVNQLTGGVEPTIARQSGLPPDKVAALLNNKVSKEIAEGSVTPDEFAEFSKYRTSGSLQSMRSELMAISRDKNLTPADKLIADDAAKAIDKIAETSFDPENYARWKDARDFTADTATMFKRNTPGGALLDGKSTYDKLPGRIFKNDRNYIQNVKRVLQEPELIDEFKRSVIESIPRDANNKLTLSGYKNYLRKNETGFKELFGGEHYEDLKVILDDLQSEAIPNDVGFLASKNNSQTAQRVTVAKTLSDAISNKTLNRLSWVPGVREWVADISKINSNKIKQELFNASLDPQMAKILLRSPTENRIISVVERLKMLADEGAIDLGRALLRRPEMIQGDQPETQDLRNDQLGTSQSREQYSYIDNQPDLLLEQSREAERASQVQKSGVDTLREDSKQQTSYKSRQGVASTNQQQLPRESAPSQEASISPTSQPPVIELRANPPLPMSAQQIMFKPRTSQSFRQSDNEGTAGVDETLLDAIRWVESRDGKYTKSPAGALGDYQFMPKTAKAYGVNLYDNDPTDDREGARKLLIDEHGALGEMALAIAAYNAGRPAITRAQAKAEKAGMGSDFVSILPFLSEETQNYVPLVYEAIDRLKSKRV